MRTSVPGAASALPDASQRAIERPPGRRWGRWAGAALSVLVGCAGLPAGSMAGGDGQPAARSQPAPARRAPPNILFIVIDDLNDWVSPLGGHPQSHTPNIARLAAGGTTFANAHAQAPICGPSRASALTGLRPSTTGIYGQKPAWRAADSTRSATTIFQHFAAHGYRTFGAGKIFHYLGTEDQRKEFDVVGPNLDIVPRKRKIVSDEGLSTYSEIDWGADEVAGSSASDRRIAQWAAGTLQGLSASGDDRPFVLGVGFYLPHIPIYVPKAYYDRVPAEKDIVLPPVPEGDLADVPAIALQLHRWKPNLPGKIPVEPDLAWLRQHGQWRSLVRAYLAGIRSSDEQVGMVLSALAGSRFRDNTIVVLWSDHGWHLGEKGLVGKSTLWERSTHVPLIFAGPGIAAGKRVSSPAELIDIFPTLADLSGLWPVPALDGLSLRPQLRRAGARRSRPAVTSYHFGNFAVRDSRWRYIRYADGSEELYDHRADPGEFVNLACRSGLAGVRRRLAAALPAAPARPVANADDPVVLRQDGMWSFSGKPAAWTAWPCPP